MNAVLAVDEGLDCFESRTTAVTVHSKPKQPGLQSGRFVSLLDGAVHSSGSAAVRMGY